MPSAARRCGGCAPRARSSKTIRPARTGRWPITLRISVVLPAPLRPTRPTTAPSGTSRLRPRSASTFWIETWSDSTFSIASLLLDEQLAGDVAAHVVARERRPGCAVGDDPPGVEGDHPARLAPLDLPVRVH